jgi:Fe-S-cluster containining protein
MLKVIQDDKPWYSEGLNFECTGCGQCCTGAPGYVWVTEDEIIAMANHLELTIHEFTRRYLRRVGLRYSLIEDAKTFDCVFLKNNKCEIYTVRPIQCRTFPWWPQNLKSKEDWEEAATKCEGIRKLAPSNAFTKIEEQRLYQEETIKKYEI